RSFEYSTASDLCWRRSAMWCTQFYRWLWTFWLRNSFVLLLDTPPQALGLPPVKYSHAGICPNDMNPNLWVDAQSTCQRECETD
ncbi:hypothetical protein NDU88_008258, partial [Pleurodeles waltl]